MQQRRVPPYLAGVTRDKTTRSQLWRRFFTRYVSSYWRSLAAHVTGGSVEGGVVFREHARIPFVVVAAIALIGAVVPMLANAPAAQAATQDGWSYVSAPFVYTRATSVRCTTCTISGTHTFLRLMPGGTATFSVSNTPDVYMSAFGNGRTFSVIIDGNAPITGKTSTCNCWETDRIGPAGLSLGTHKIVFTNTTASGYDPTTGPAGGPHIQQWKAHTGGTPLHNVTYVNANDPSVSYSNATFTAD